jgi:hypothetical protein
MFANSRVFSGSTHLQRRNDKFLQLLPAITHQVEFAFRNAPAEAREELVQEAIAQAYGLFISLCRRRKSNLAYATPLARFAIRRTRAGRRLGNSSNSQDIMSCRVNSSRAFVVNRLERPIKGGKYWREVLVEDRSAGPAETVAARLDYCDWLATLSSRDRRLAEKLAIGETTGYVARMFHISSARVSQLRRQLCESWHRFVGDEAVAFASPAAPA